MYTSSDGSEQDDYSKRSEQDDYGESEPKCSWIPARYVSRTIGKILEWLSELMLEPLTLVLAVFGMRNYILIFCRCSEQDKPCNGREGAIACASQLCLLRRAVVSRN